MPRGEGIREGLPKRASQHHLPVWERTTVNSSTCSTNSDAQHLYLRDNDGQQEKESCHGDEKARHGGG